MGICTSSSYDTAQGTSASKGRGAAGNANGGQVDMVAYLSGAMGMMVRKTGTAVQAKMRNASLNFTRQPPSEEYSNRAGTVIPANIKMFSGCKDSQTSADVSDVTSFGIPAPDPSEKAGGACTNSLLHTLNNTTGPITFGALLVKMQKTLKERKYTQIPQLCASHNTKLQEEVFTVWNPIGQPRSGRTRALLIGVNYFNQDSELNGCVNDVAMMKRYLVSQGYASDTNGMRVLTDDGKNNGMPTGAEILKGLAWLVEGAKAGDSLFLHFSGHGTQQKDAGGDEEDGMDEAIVPCDYEKNGLITDDTLFQLLCGKLPADAHLVCLFDCCHSGTMMDLPFIFSATGEAAAALEAGENLQMQENPSFNFDFAEQLVASIAKGVFNQLLKASAQNYHMYGENDNNGGYENARNGEEGEGTLSGMVQRELFSMASELLGGGGGGQ